MILSTKDDGEMICKPTLATDKIEELPELGLCLICTKSYDLNDVLERLKPKVKDHTKIIPLLNGIDICNRIRTVIKNGNIYPHVFT